MFNFFYRHLPLKKSLICFLITAVLFISGGYVLLLPQKAQAMYPVTDYKKWITDKISWAYEKGKLYATTAATTVSATIAAWEKNESWIAQITYMAAEIALRQVLAMITNDIIDWVKSGYKGKPAFLDQKFGDFLAEAGNNAGGDFVTQYLGAGWLCEPFDANIKIALLQEKKFNETAKCTIKDMGKNLKNFYADFSQGGWEQWLKLTEPQNNFYGALMLAKDAKDQAEQDAKDSVEKDLTAGKGFLSIQDCVWYDANDREVITQENVRGNPPLPDVCIPHPDDPQHATIGGFMPPCKPVCTVKTPGSVVSEVTNKNFTQGIDRLNMTLANLTGKAGSFFKPYIMAIADAMVNQLITAGLAEVKRLGPDTKHDKEPLPEGQKLPKTDNLPNYVQQELTDIQTLLENLKMLEKNNSELYLVQQKIINLFEKKDEKLTSWPADFLTYLNTLWPILGNVKTWEDICVPCLESNRGLFSDKDKFDRKKENYLTLIRKYLTFEELGSQRIFVSQQETPTSKTTIEKSGKAYSFSSVGSNTGLFGKELFDEGILVLIDTKETTVDQSGVITVNTEAVPVEHYYNLIDWYVKIEGLDQLDSKPDQEAINQVKQVMNDFIAKIKTEKTQTEKITPITSQSIPAVKNYLSAAESYLTFFEQNLTSLDFDKVNAFKETYKTNPASLNIINPDSNFGPDGKPDLNAIFAAKEIALFNDRGAAIAAVQKIGQPQPFESTAFKDLNGEVQEFSSSLIENSGKLTELLGDKSNVDKSDLYGFIKALDDIVYSKNLYHMCATGTLP